ncbi:hypothetical protein H2248_005714 [Termitomyces sp. 'cryptogamus']|nr:hypothetical protein H2248_005714 [Termitomyces sp. 'cryptogamus']
MKFYFARDSAVRRLDLFFSTPALEHFVKVQEKIMMASHAMQTIPPVVALSKTVMAVGPDSAFLILSRIES